MRRVSMQPGLRQVDIDHYRRQAKNFNSPEIAAKADRLQAVLDRLQATNLVLEDGKWVMPKCASSR